MLVAISLLSSAFARWSCHVSRMRLLSDSSQTGLITDYGSGAGLSTLRSRPPMKVRPWTGGRLLVDDPHVALGGGFDAGNAVLQARGRVAKPEGRGAGSRGSRRR